MLSLKEARTSKERLPFLEEAELKRSDTNHKAKTTTDENGLSHNKVAITVAKKSLLVDSW